MIAETKIFPSYESETNILKSKCSSFPFFQHTGTWSTFSKLFPLPMEVFSAFCALSGRRLVPFPVLLSVGSHYFITFQWKFLVLFSEHQLLEFLLGPSNAVRNMSIPATVCNCWIFDGDLHSSLLANSYLDSHWSLEEQQVSWFKISQNGNGCDQLFLARCFSDRI